MIPCRRPPTRWYGSRRRRSSAVGRDGYDGVPAWRSKFRRRGRGPLWCLGHRSDRNQPLTRSALLAIVALLLVLTQAACTSGGSSSGRPTSASRVVPPPETKGVATEDVLLAAGDIASCSSDGDEATAGLLDQRSGTIATLGDNAYPDGSTSDFARCYEPSWGRHKARTRPAPGNHDYETGLALGYFGYFGQSAGEPSNGYYSFKLGAWHVVVLNSNCAEVSCEAGSRQEKWLRADLASHPDRCTVAYWHHARFSSGQHGSNQEVAPLFRALYDHDADVVLAGHDHHYERFAPLDSSGRTDAARGVRTFVVGTGGASLRPVERVLPTSEIHNSDTFGILALGLKPNGYWWEFVPQPGRSFTDSGAGTCH
jgi:acid phosphatase type 7